MRRRVIGAGLVLALLTIALVMTTAGSAKPEQSPLKVAFIYPGPHNDGGWAQAHDRGRLLV
jgi:basic membrane protein A